MHVSSSRRREYTPGRSAKASQISKTFPKTKKSPAAERPPGNFVLSALLQRSAGRGQYLAEHAGFRQRGNPRLVIAERIAQYVPGVLAEQRRCDGIDDRRQRHIEWGFDVRNGACFGMRDLADAMALTRLRRVKGFFHGAQETDRNIGRLHSRHPILAGVLRKDFGEDGA